MLMFTLLSLSLALQAAPSVDHRDILKRPGPSPASARAGAPPPPAMQRDWDLTHYDISLSLDPYYRQIRGDILATAQARVDSPGALLLHAGEPSIEAVEIEAAPASFSRSGDELWVEVPAGLAAGESVAVRVVYTAPGTTDGSSTGLHWGDPIYSFSEPEGARDWLVVYDAPADKATMTLRVTAPEELFVVSNGERTVVEEPGDGTRSWSFDFPWPIATYLIVVNAGAFEEFVDDSGEVPVYTWAGAGEMRQAKEVFGDTPEMIEHLSELWVPYPYSHYGNALVPFGGAMEHTTATSFGQDLIWHGDYAMIVNVHELGHQWWGDHVTCAEWEEIWLNEGFASYTEALWLEHAWGEEWLAWYVWEEQRASYLAWHDYEGVFALYDPDYMWGGTVYDKGSFVVHMLRFVMGDEAFFEGLRLYAQTHAHDVATTEDLRAVMESVHGGSLGWFFDQWVYRAGDPSYRVGLSNTRLRDGSWQVDVHVEQTASETWSMPVEWLLELEDGSQRADERWVEGAYSVHSVCLDQAAVDLEFSPHANLLYERLVYDLDGYEPAEIVCGEVEPGETGDSEPSPEDSGPGDSEGGVEPPAGLCGCAAPPSPGMVLLFLSTLGALPWIRRRR
jgi:aminopeptidase N